MRAITLIAGLFGAAVFAVFLAVSSIFASNHVPGDRCDQLPGHSALREALIAARNMDNGGFDLNVWGAVVNRDGVVCAVAYTGVTRGDQWPGSRVISAQKANTANAFSLPGLALSSANLYSVAQPGESAYGIEHGNPVDTETAYRGNPRHYGQPNDPLTGRHIGGTIPLGGGLPLYNQAGELLGAVGVSGDTSCADHFVAWRTRNNLSLDFGPNDDNIIFDISEDANGHPSSASGLGHPNCLDPGVEQLVLDTLPPLP
jgi:uncharacterized protein GlcG (DUF336 family)